MNKSTITIFIILLSAFTLVWFSFPIKTLKIAGNTPIQQEIIDKPQLKLKVTKDKILNSKEEDLMIRNPDKTFTNAGRVVSYDYISDKKVDGKFIWHGEYSNAKIVSENGNEKTVNIYSGDQFYKDINGVFQIETATTTPEAYTEQTKLTLIDRIFKTAQATNFNPSIDGYVSRAGGSYTYNGIHEAAGNGSATTNNTLYLFLNGSVTTDQFRNNYKSLVFFDTSTIGAGNTVTAASLFLYGAAKTNALGSPNIDIVQGGSASPTAIVDGDYAHAYWGHTSFAEVTYANWSTAAYNEFALNASGKSAIIVDGTTQFGVTMGWEVSDPPVFGGTWDNSEGGPDVSSWSSEYTGTDHDPYLSVTYSAPVTPPDDGTIIFE